MGWLLPFLENPQDYVEETNTSSRSTLDMDEDAKLTVCLLQPRLREDQDHPLQATDQVVALMQAAACQEEAQQPQPHIDLFVLPELCPVGYSEDTFANYLPSDPTAQAMYHQIDDKLQQAAVSLHSYICYGTIGWKSQPTTSKDDDDGRQGPFQYFIRQVVVDPNGHQIASYDKIHLCDYGDCAETRFFTPGDTVVSFPIGRWRFGLIICADMRYPNLSRTLTHHRDHQVDVILQPACFARDISFATWKAFRTTRAVENGVYFVGCNYAGDNFGASSLTPPWVDDTTPHLPQVMTNTAGYMTHTLDRAVLQHARTTMPFYNHATQSGSSCPCVGND
jgi:predicted amidohydrolase